MIFSESVGSRANVTFNNETSRNKMLAQAYTMRAFMYFVMTRTWGDLIIHTDPIENTNSEVLYKERRPQTEVFQLIKDDLEKALSLYPDDNFGDQRAMWSKPATLALKAEVYLWSGKKMNGGSSDIETALNALNSIKTDKLRLQPDFADVFAYDNKGNDEILMSVRFQDLESGINYFRYMWIHASAVPGDAPQEVKDIVYPIGPGQGIIVASDEYRKQYTEDDTRKNASFLEIYSKDQETGENKFYVSVVLKGKGLVRDGDRIFADDIILYRYADILLMKAEAKNALGQDPSAEINEVRKRAYKDKYEEHIYVNSTKEANDAAILKERLLELAFEGKRWWDLVRFDKAFDLVPSLREHKGEDYMMLFPIPLSTISVEPKVTQNPGWDK